MNVYNIKYTNIDLFLEGFLESSEKTINPPDEIFFSDEDVMNEIVDKYEQQLEKDQIDADELIQDYQSEIEKQQKDSLFDVKLKESKE